MICNCSLIFRIIRAKAVSIHFFKLPLSILHSFEVIILSH